MVNHPRGDEYRFMVVTVPFLEEYTNIQIDGNTMSKYDGMKPPNRIVPMKGTKPVDPRFDLENCAYTLKDILTEGLGIERAHFVGLDRRRIIMDNMLAEFPEFFSATPGVLRGGPSSKIGMISRRRNLSRPPSQDNGN